MAIEYEEKFQADEISLAELREAFSPFAEFQMETTYFDTPSRALSQRRWMLRRRLENGISMCTLKTPMVGNSRMEYEVWEKDIHRAIGQLIQVGAPKELAELAAEGLEPVSGARFLRQTRQISVTPNIFELAIDVGEVVAGDLREPFIEVELELKEGSHRDAHVYALGLASAYVLSPQKKSKAQRAMALAARAEKEKGEKSNG